MVKRLLVPLLLLVPVAIIAQIDWTKQVKNIPSYVANALPDPGANGFVKRTAANTSTVAGSTDVWPGTLPYTSLTGGASAGTIPFSAVTGTSVAWPGTLPYSSLTSVPTLLGDPGANGVVYRNGAGTTAAATGANLPLMGASGTNHSAGAVPDPGATAGNTHFLREDGTWVTVSGGVSTQNANLQSGSRAFTTVYQNTTGKPMFVVVSVNIGSGMVLYAYTDPSATPSVTVAALSGPTTTIANNVAFWVLPNNYYKVTISGSVTLNNWTEWY